MSNVLAFPATRTLAQVIAELMPAEAELQRLEMATFGRALSDTEDARWTQLDDTIWNRRIEAKAMIEAATGVSWAAIEGAGL